MMEQMMGGNGSMTLAPGASAGVGRDMMGDCDTNDTSPPNVSAEMTVNPEQAIRFAQKYLDENLPGAKIAHHTTKFYGYYTLDFEKDGKVAGMLGVSGYSGQVFLHPWHGTFLKGSEIQ